MIDSLNLEIDVMNQRNNDLVVTLEVMGKKCESLEKTLDEERKMRPLNSEAEAQELRQKLQVRESELDVLRAEMVQRSKTKFKEIDELKKQLVDTERSFNRYYNSCLL